MRMIATSKKGRARMAKDAGKARLVGRSARRAAPKRTLAALAALAGVAGLAQLAKTLRKEPKSDVYPPKGYPQPGGSS